MVGSLLFFSEGEPGCEHIYTGQGSIMSAEGSAFDGATKSTAARGCFIYEGDRAVNEYLQFHFGR